MKSNILAEPVLVGRAHELEKLQLSLASAIKGRGTTIFISGEAGAGKTRLVHEFLNRAKKQGVTILTGWCLSNAAVPYFPFFEAFNRYFATEPQEELQTKNWLMGPLQAGSLGRTQAITPQVWKDQTFTTVANTLSQICAKHPVILFIDDVHWADSASLALIHYLARTVNSEKALILATFRSEQLVADAEGRPHPLTETIRLMRREDAIKEINVSNLDQTGISELAENMLGGVVQQEFAHKLAQESQGNPLFVIESLRLLDERGDILLENGKWRLTSDKIGIPPKIKDVILQRLGTLSRNQRNLLDIASVIGEKFDGSLLASMLNQEAFETIKLLDSISKDTSLVAPEGELYRFDHGRTREVIYDDISPALKRVYHARIAEKLENTKRNGRLPLIDLAYQYAHAGNQDKAIKYALASGQDALSKWSNSEAIKLFSFVLQTIGESKEHNQEKVEALEGLGDAYYASNNLSQAVSTFEQLAELPNAAKERAIRKAAEAAIYLGNITHQKALVEKAEAMATANRLEAAKIRHLRVFLIESPSDWIIARKTGEQILQVFEEENAISEAAQVLRWIAYGQAMLGALEAGVESALRSIALLEELGDYRSLIESYAYAGGTLQACSFLEEANGMFSRAVEVNEKYKICDYVRLFPAYVWEAMGLVGTDTRSAISKALKALEYFEKTDSQLYAGAVYGILIVAHALVGDTQRVDEYFGKLMSLSKDILSNAPTQIYIAPTMGVYHAAKREFEKSNKIFTDWLAAIGQVFPSPFYEASSRQLYAWSLANQGKLEEASAQSQKAQNLIENAKKRFDRLNIAPTLIMQTSLEANQTFPIRFDLINVSSKAGKIVKISAIPEYMQIIEVSPNCTVCNSEIVFKEGEIGAFEVKSVKLIAKAPNLVQSAEFPLSPMVTYVDDMGEIKSRRSREFKITVSGARFEASRPPEEPTKEKQPLQLDYEVLPNRMPTGYAPLDRLLLGGIPETDSMVLTSPSIDERDLLIKRFLEGGAESGETIFYVSTEISPGKALAEKYPRNVYFFVCNAQADSVIPIAPNISKLKGIENLTNIEIALTKAMRSLPPSQAAKRICIAIVSDVLLRDHAVITRKWLSSILPALKAQGFTTMAVLNPLMHPKEETQAIQGLFDGEILLQEEETATGTEKTLRVRKLRDQKYLENEIKLTRESFK